MWLPVNVDKTRCIYEKCSLILQFLNLLLPQYMRTTWPALLCLNILSAANNLAPLIFDDVLSASWCKLASVLTLIPRRTSKIVADALTNTKSFSFPAFSKHCAVMFEHTPSLSFAAHSLRVCGG